MKQYYLSLFDIDRLLKDAYLEIANKDLHITEDTSKSDVQTLTCSKFREFVSKNARRLVVSNELNAHIKDFELEGCEISEDDIDNVLNRMDVNGDSLEDACKNVLSNIKAVLEYETVDPDEWIDDDLCTECRTHCSEGNIDIPCKNDKSNCPNI